MKKLLIALIVITLSACTQTTTKKRECTDQQAAIDGMVKVVGILKGNAVWGGC